MAVGQNQWYGAPPTLVYFSGWIGMFTGGTIWLLTHGQMTVKTLSPEKGLPLGLQELGITGREEFEEAGGEELAWMLRTTDGGVLPREEVWFLWMGYSTLGKTRSIG